jgi:hypothetical protein
MTELKPAFDFGYWYVRLPPSPAYAFCDDCSEYNIRWKLPAETFGLLKIFKWLYLIAIPP